MRRCARHRPESHGRLGRPQALDQYRQRDAARVQQFGGPRAVLRANQMDLVHPGEHSTGPTGPPLVLPWYGRFVLSLCPAYGS